MRRKGPTSKVTINLPDQLIQAVDAELIEPVRNKPFYGAWSHLIANLLQDWIDHQKDTRRDERARSSPNSPGSSFNSDGLVEPTPSTSTGEPILGGQNSVPERDSG